MNMSHYVRVGGLQIAQSLHHLLEQAILPATGVTVAEFWRGLEQTIEQLGGRNRSLLKRRNEMQLRIDQWVRDKPDELFDAARHEAFLRSIDYLVEAPDDCSIDPRNVDPEIARIAGPQLVVPVDNARYALNAANARWGSLYDALYGTDVIAELPGLERGAQYNPIRGYEVVATAMLFLDQAVPLDGISHGNVDRYEIDASEDALRLVAMNSDGGQHPLSRPEGFRGFRAEASSPAAILLENNGLHIEISIDPAHHIGMNHSAGVCDVILEAAISTIQDCEDSVTAVDAQDKSQVYANWHGLMQGTLETTVSKGDQSIVRRLNPDRLYRGADGKELKLPGRCLLLVRNVGMHMYTNAVLDARGEPIPEGFLDAFVTVAAAHRNVTGNTALRNSRTGSIYVVKPKQHGPEEVALTVELFSRVEDVLGLENNTVKLGIMDEERRTTLNLKACIAAAKERVIFINTGFLDRTGDEIHTLMEAGPFIPKQEIKQAKWMLAYEDWNVDTGLACGLSGRAQIGKGMWAMPEDMAAMVNQKIEHPRAGANTAWVPSPTAATLHAMHYHSVSVAARQEELMAQPPRAVLADLLAPCLLGERHLTVQEVTTEVRNNAQSILGYVVCWIDQGVGCSKVPDINDLSLMEDRATLRISSQHLGNWLRHGLVSRDELLSRFKEMAVIVDRQNAGDQTYRPMAADFDNSNAFQAALHLVVDATKQPNGYTEFILNEWRRKAKRKRN